MCVWQFHRLTFFLPKSQGPPPIPNDSVVLTRAKRFIEAKNMEAESMRRN